MSKRSMKLGFDGQLVEVAVEVPADSATPWDADSELAHVGRPVTRLDGRAKVTGTATYTADIHLEGMLYGAMLRSPHPAARVSRLDVEAARRMPGVRAVHPIAKKGYRIRYEGQPIAAVAADTLHQARDAARALAVEYEVLAHVTDLDEAQKKTAPRVYPAADQAPGRGRLPIEGNVRGPAVGGRRFAPTGDVAEGWRVAAAKVEAEFRTAVQTHSAMEPHGSVVRATDDGGFEVWTSTQSIASVVRDVARAMDVPRTKVRVRCDFLGGGFGAKFGAGDFTIAAAELSRVAKRPVRMMLDRRAEHLAGGNRPSSHQQVRLGADDQGVLTVVDMVSKGSAGVGTGAGVAAPYYTIYDCPNRRTEEYDIFTNAGRAAAFRAPGHPQGVFGLESSMDMLAARLGMDPIDLRLANDPHPVRRAQWSLARKRFDWDAKRRRSPSKGSVVRGVGAAASVWYNIVEKGVGATVEIHRDGSVVVLSGVQDIGTGIRTVMAQVTGEVLGLPPEAIDVRIGDSALPLGPGSGGSKTTASLTPAVHRAAETARDKLAKALARAVGPASDLVFRDGHIALSSGGNRMAFSDAASRLRVEKITATAERGDDLDGLRASDDLGLQKVADRIAGVQLAEVEVDKRTGQVRVLEVLAVHDAGRVMNELQARGQINGGVIQGVSYALYEERVLDPFTGRMINANLESYRVAGLADLPTIDAVMTTVHSGRSSTGAMGLGEPTTIPTAAAIANAVAHATGSRVFELPMTPERVLAALSSSAPGGVDGRSGGG